jgi:hypothetical protein
VQKIAAHPSLASGDLEGGPQRFSGFGDSVLGREHAGLDFDIAFLGLDVKMNADGALTRQLANEGRAFSSDVDVEQRDQDDAGGNDSHSDEGQCDAIGRRR